MSASVAGPFKWVCKTAKGGDHIWKPVPLDPLGDADVSRDELVDAADFAEHLGLDPDQITEAEWIAKYSHEVDQLQREADEVESDLVDDVELEREMTEDEMAVAANKAAIQENKRLEEKDAASAKREAEKGAARMKQERDRYLKVGRLDAVVQTLASFVGAKVTRVLPASPVEDSTLVFEPGPGFLPLILRDFVSSIKTLQEENQALRADIQAIAQGLSLERGPDGVLGWQATSSSVIDVEVITKKGE